jgi:hypothetical protein
MAVLPSLRTGIACLSVLGSLAGLCLVLPSSALASDLETVGEALEPDVRGSVKVRTLGDGTQVIYNENREQKARRTSSTLLSPPRGSDLSDKIARYARAQGLSPRLVQAVVQVESGYNPRALSSKGAMGLMQLMPDTARDLGVVDAYDPDQNLRGGTRYLWQQIRRFQGNLELALAAYNAGPTAVARHDGVPPYEETRRYIAKVMSLYQNSPPPQWLVDQARADSTDRRIATVEKVVKEEKARVGDKVYLTRDETGRIVMTTTPPPHRR